MAIQWFPGHMTRAKKAIEELSDEIDIVIELFYFYKNNTPVSAAIIINFNGLTLVNALR